MATQTIEIRAVDKTQTALRNIENNTKRLESSFGGVTRAAKGFIAVLAAREVLQFGSAIKDNVAEMQNLNNRLRLITTSQSQLTQTQTMLTAAAIENRTAYADTVDLYTKLTLATEALGVSQEEVLAVTGSLSKALQVSGADAATTSSVIRQFGQAMASGTVRGDEFNSLVEGLGPALAIMARETGLTVGQLRTMSRNGELTAEVLFKMLENSTELERAFQSMAPTIDQLETQLVDAFKRATVAVANASGATSAYERGLGRITRLLDDIADTPGALVNLSNQEFFEGIINGSIKGQAALTELNERTRLTDSAFGSLGGRVMEFFGIIDSGDTTKLREGLEQLRQKLQEGIDAERAAAQAATDQAEAQRVLNDAIREATAPFSSYIQLAETYERTGFGSALVKNETNIRRVNEALEQLRVASETVISATGENVISNERYTELVRVLTLELAHLEQQNVKLREAQNELTASTDAYGAFLTDLIKTMNESVQMDQFKQRAITEISARYRDGTYTLQQYEAAMLQLDSTFETSSQRQQREAKETATALKTIGSEVERLRESYATYFMDRIQQAEHATAKEIATLQQAYTQGAIDLQEYNDLRLRAEQVLQDKVKELRDKAAEEELKRQEAIVNKNLQLFQQGKFGEVDVSELSEDQKKEYAIKSGREALDALAKHNKTAFNAMKALNIAEAIMNTYTGATKALASFPPPFNFIAAAAVVAAGLANVATIRAQTYTGRQRGGDLRAGQSAIVGEDGPELIVPKQGSTVIPREVAQAIEGMGGNGGPVTVNFNINTVDARGFDELLIERRGTITGIINNAMQQRGRMGVV